ncbi:MFS transporter [Propionicicella superfundia]|uniref:MFS transporter n=1 Tax=Propionicicella superfundia TaxID=348582 RepID=UPI0003F9B65E|nr:MFS transporter [Propionicicella superfundia]
MNRLAGLRRLWRHRRFRRLLAVRIATQSADGLTQVTTAAYVLFSPQSQPDAWSIVTILAIALLPFSLLGPFVSGLLDRWNRRQVIVVTDLVRAVVCLSLGALIVTGVRGGWRDAAFFALVLVSMSLNRFMLAGLSASLEHTIDPDEYLTANSVMPIVGPIGTALGGGAATIARLTLSTVWPTYRADALLFTVAAAGFALSLTISLGFTRDALGPRADAARPASARSVLGGLTAALRHIAARRPAAIGLATIGVHRIWHGAASVGVILLFRTYFHRVDEVTPALADLGVWGAATAAGFIAASFVTPLLTRWMGLKRWILVLLVGCGVFQIVPGSIFVPVALFVAAGLIGVLAQSIKICVDTLVQTHIDDEYKGRVFIWYDMLFNVVQVGSAALAALLLPPDGASTTVFVLFGVGYLLTAVGFALATARIPAAEFARDDARAAPGAA